jgi:hypothetical protein
MPGMAKIPAPMVAPIPRAASMTQPKCFGVSAIVASSTEQEVFRINVVNIDLGILI